VRVGSRRRPQGASKLERRISRQDLLTLALAIVFAGTLALQASLLIRQEGAFYPGGEVPVGSDLLVFYSAGRIVADGDGARLYEPARQLAEQVEVLGRDRGVAIFPYPAFVALPYAALARLSLPWAYVIATAAMLAATLAAMWMLRGASPTARDQPALVALAILVSQPFGSALFGGQVVAFTLLCFTGLYCGLRQGRDLAAGIWLGLLFYKPQMSVVLVLLLILQRQWRTLTVAGLVGATLTALGALAAGPTWPRSFLGMVLSDYYRNNAIVADGSRSLSLPGVTRHLAGLDATWAMVAALVLCLFILVLVARSWRNVQEDGRFPLQFAIAMVATLIVSPHALYYEAGLLVLPLILLADHWRAQLEASGSARLIADWQALALAGLAIFGAARSLLISFVPFEPMVAAPIIVGLLVWRELHPTQAASMLRPRAPLSP
jgi:alpha-1,2-mannosyltransferase